MRWLSLILPASLLLTACGSVVEVPGQSNPSCALDRAGADHDCGVQNDADCCGAATVPGGTYNRLNTAVAPATVSAFGLDTFEVTVGRFRAFVDAYPGLMPQPGDGANPHLPGSGWQAAWTAKLPPTQAALIAALQCPNASPSYVTWTNTPANNENTPVSCLTWYTAFAFCAWDAGRLPTLAEWDFAAVGGGEQRPYPWGSLPTRPDARGRDVHAAECDHAGRQRALGCGPLGPPGPGRKPQRALPRRRGQQQPFGRRTSDAVRRLRSAPAGLGGNQDAGRCELRVSTGRGAESGDRASIFLRHADRRDRGRPLRTRRAMTAQAVTVALTVALVAASGCGGNVVVDSKTQGGATTSSTSGATTSASSTSGATTSSSTSASTTTSASSTSGSTNAPSLCSVAVGVMNMGLCANCAIKACPSYCAAPECQGGWTCALLCHNDGPCIAQCLASNPAFLAFVQCIVMAGCEPACAPAMPLACPFDGGV